MVTSRPSDFFGFSPFVAGAGTVACAGVGLAEPFVAWPFAGAVESGLMAVLTLSTIEWTAAAIVMSLTRGG